MEFLGFNWTLGGAMEFCGALWRSIGLYRVLWGSTGRYGVPWGAMGCRVPAGSVRQTAVTLLGTRGRYGVLGVQSGTRGRYGALWGTMAFYRALWSAIGSCGALWGAMGTQAVSIRRQ